MAYNGIKLKADRLYKRLGDGGLILGCVSWCVSLWADSVCFCSFLRREGIFNYTDL